MRAVVWKGETHYLTEAEVRGLKERLQSRPRPYDEKGYARVMVGCPVCELYDRCSDCPLQFRLGNCMSIARFICGDALWSCWHRSQAHKAAAVRRKLVRALEALPRVRNRSERNYHRH
mgnify:CR=1 FL=1